MEILTLLIAAWTAIAPYLAFLEPIVKIGGPVLAEIAPYLDIVSGPVSAVFVYGFMPFYLLWLFYLAVMTLKRGRDARTLTGVGYAFAYPILIVGLLLDFFVNVFGCSILFFDLPREGTMTARLKRYAAQPGTWRFTMTVFIAKHFLDKFDPDGYHVAEVYIAASAAVDANTPTEALAAVAALATDL